MRLCPHSAVLLTRPRPPSISPPPPPPPRPPAGGAWITQALLLVLGSIHAALPVIAVAYTGVILSWLRAVLGWVELRAAACCRTSLARAPGAATYLRISTRHVAVRRWQELACLPPPPPLPPLPRSLGKQLKEYEEEKAAAQGAPNGTAATAAGGAAAPANGSNGTDVSGTGGAEQAPAVRPQAA